MDVTTMKGIVCPRPLLNQGCAHQSNSMKVSLCLWQLHPGRVWKCWLMWLLVKLHVHGSPLLVPSAVSAKFSWNFSVKLFFLYVALLLSTFISSVTGVLLWESGTQMSHFRMQTRMLARDHSYFLLDSCPTSHLFPYTATAPHLPV